MTSRRRTPSRSYVVGQAHRLSGGAVPVDLHDLASHDVGGPEIALQSRHQRRPDLGASRPHRGRPVGTDVEVGDELAVLGEQLGDGVGVGAVDVVGVGVDEQPQRHPGGDVTLGLLHPAHGRRDRARRPRGARPHPGRLGPGS